MPIKVSYLPAAGRNYASSRVRVYGVLGALRALGVETRIGPWFDADVVLVQKRLTKDVVGFARAAKRRGALLVYDCDDAGAALEYWAPAPLRRDFLPEADVVTTNSTGFRDEIIGEYKTVAISPFCRTTGRRRIEPRATTE